MPEPLVHTVVALVMCTECQSVRVMVPNETRVGVYAASAADKLAGKTTNLYTCNRCNGPKIFRKIVILFESFFIGDFA
jgi:hypothetical protein